MTRVAEESTTSAVLRRAVMPDDIPALTQLYLETAQAHVAIAPHRYSVPDLAALPRQVEGLAASEDVLLLVAENGDGDVIGMVVAQVAEPVGESNQRWDGRVLHIADVVVAERARRHGLATILLEQAEGWGKGRGARDVTLTVDALNAGALELYRKLGYTSSTVRLRKELSAR